MRAPEKGDNAWVVLNLSPYSYDYIPKATLIEVGRIGIATARINPGNILVSVAQLWPSQKEAERAAKGLVETRLAHYKERVAKMEAWLDDL